MRTKKKLQKQWNRIVRWYQLNEKNAQIAAAVAVVLLLLLIIIRSRHVYEGVRELDDYSRNGTDNYSYVEFQEGMIRYSRDGVAYLDHKNEELWNQPGQIQNPEVITNAEAFVVLDSGGNDIMIFDEKGLKGEISTTLPIEKASVSKQGIVAVILKNENSPKIMVYDIAGNILVELQTAAYGTGYPVALALSEDANLLGVSYAMVEGTTLKSQLVYYNFGSVGQGKTDNIVTSDVYEETIIPYLFFVDHNKSVAVSDAGFMIYEGKQIPELVKKVDVEKEIKSICHSEKYIGMVLNNTGRAGYELRLFSMNGNQTMSADFQGDYGKVKISNEEVIMLEGSRGCIFTTKGRMKFQGNLDMDASEIVALNGKNKYLLMNSNVVKKVRLAK